MGLKCVVCVLRYRNRSFLTSQVYYSGCFFWSHGVLHLEKLLKVLPKWKPGSAQSSVMGDSDWGGMAEVEGWESLIF